MFYCCMLFCNILTLTCHIFQSQKLKNNSHISRTIISLSLSPSNNRRALYSLVNVTSEYGCDCGIVLGQLVVPDSDGVRLRRGTPRLLWHAHLTGGLQRLRQTGDEVIRYAPIVLEELQDVRNRRVHSAEQRCRSDKDGRQAWASD